MTDDTFFSDDLTTLQSNDTPEINEETTNNNNIVTNKGNMPGWKISLIVVGCVVVVGLALGLGLGLGLHGSSNAVTPTATITPFPTVPQPGPLIIESQYMYIPTSTGNALGTLVMLDTKSNTVTSQISSASKNPRHATLTPNLKTVYMSCPFLQAQQVDVFTIANTTMTYATSINLSAYGNLTGYSVVSPDGEHLYISVGSSVVVIATATNTVEFVLTNAAILSPATCVVHPSGHEIYISDFLHWQIYVIDATKSPQLRYTSTIPLPRSSTNLQLVNLCITNDGKTLYCIPSTQAPPPAVYAYAIDVDDETVTVSQNPINYNGVALSYDNVAGFTVSPDASKLFCAINTIDTNQSVTNIISTHTLAVQGRVAMQNTDGSLAQLVCNEDYIYSAGEWEGQELVKIINNTSNITYNSQVVIPGGLEFGSAPTKLIIFGQGTL